MTTTHTHTGGEPPKGGDLTLAKIISIVRKDIVEYDIHTSTSARNSIAIAVHLGKHLRVAKSIVGHGKWGAWLDKNFKLRGTWLRICMRASECMEFILRRSDAEEVLARVLTVEKLARLYNRAYDDMPIDDLFNKTVPRARRMPANIPMSAARRAFIDHYRMMDRSTRLGTPLDILKAQTQSFLVTASTEE